MTDPTLLGELPIPLAAQIDCVKREIAMRERVYPRWIESKKIAPQRAEKEIAAMRAVLATLKGVRLRRDDGK